MKSLPIIVAFLFTTTAFAADAPNIYTPQSALEIKCNEEKKAAIIDGPSCALYKEELNHPKAQTPLPPSSDDETLYLPNGGTDKKRVRPPHTSDHHSPKTKPAFENKK